MDKRHIVSSRNPGYIARVSCAFEQAGLRHELDVREGKMSISVSPGLEEKAQQVICDCNLVEAIEPPGPAFAHLTHLDAEDLQSILRNPEDWSQAEICAARQLLKMKENECRCVEEMVAAQPTGFAPAITYRTLDRTNRYGLATLTFLLPPLALLLCCFIYFHRSHTFRGEFISTFCPTSRQFARWLFPLTLLTTLLLVGWFFFP